MGFEGDFDGSLAALKSVVSDHPNHVSAHYDLGMTYMMLGMDDEAVASFQKVINLDPTHENAQRQLAYF
jgi:tetratricopeptide (TPR) repeat protein